MKLSTNHSITHPMMRVKPLFLSVSVILGSISIAHGAVVNTNGAGVINQSNGPTIVHIKGASDKGVSHNIYSQFDVDQKGVILNNSTTNTNTTLGGQINGNLNLNNGNGPAKVILNEVNSNKASTLGGMIEVAGDKAQVIVANASGITCNNCGFINTDRVTLTTGKPIVAGGEVLGYNVEKGQIIINSRLQSDSPTDIIARSAVIRGDIHTKEINVVAGNNFVDAKGNYITKVQGVGSATRIGVDVAAMGGMYADKITLVSTESGTGVSNNGNLIAGTGGINIDSTGLVYNQVGKMNANGNINIKSNGLYNTATIVANGDVDINAQNSVLSNVNGQIKSNGGNLKLASATSVDNRSGIIHAQQDMNIATANIVNTNGSIKTNRGNIAIRATGKIDNNYTLRNNVINVDERGIRAGGDLSIDTTTLANNNSTLSGRDITINARNTVANDNSSQILAKRKIDIDSVTLQNNNSLIKSTNGQTNITLSSNLINNGYAAIDSGKALNIKANIIYNQGSLVSGAGKSKFDIYSFNNQYGFIKANNLDIKTTHLGNGRGLITADSNVVINATSADNSYASGFNSYASKFGVAGQTGGIYAKDGSVTIKADSLNNYSGVIAANQAQKAPTKGNIDIKLRNDLDNRYGKIQGANNVTLDVNKLNNTYSGTVDAGKDLTIDAFTRVDNNNGRLSSMGTTKITSPVIYNSPYGQILGSMIILNTPNYY
ncbi:filamentous hemagglutinin N-terminal domain-containing protein [Providencia rettgeri]|uniref:two-partner secretion domain-containing protein n=1 Tax=Providencia rettgeri TaxID=587 RepID=UPI0025520914|nr:filamentous hemagglutinin N-terminal domain-containing protein [Providencia rettgeri]MDK7743655.1 filamentous hemagglutinin N-terminal domain-containing protein [Providencia rettgeri]MDK7756497.1 filamentous hemagglutinin N-terminal domain-containing protein [Providencia rettgeri]